MRSNALGLVASLMTACSAPPGGTGDGGGGSGGDMSVGASGVSVLQHHMHASRDGVYSDPLLTRAAAAGLHLDTSFGGALNGAVYAQPLFVDDGAGGRDRLFVVSEDNEVTAFDVGGAVVWRKDKTVLGNPATASALPCGNIKPTLGITGTPVIDLPSRTLFFGAMTETLAGAARTHHQLIFGLSIDDGSTRPGFPIDVGASFASQSFDAAVQGQRGALVIVGSTLYVPYGGMYGDCGAYHGWVVAVPLGDPAAVKGWHTAAPEAGIWAPGGLASDGTSVFAATGNAPPNTMPFGQQESIVKLGDGARFDGSGSEIFTASDWPALDTGDIDIGGSGPVLIDVAGRHLAVALGKNGKAYLLDRDNLGHKTAGQSDGLASASVSAGEIINAAAAYTTAQASYVVFKAPCKSGGGRLQAFKIGGGAAAAPTIDLAGGWCADHKGDGSPMVSTRDGTSDAIVWAVGTESEGGAGDGRLHGFDADTGAVLFAGGGTGDKMGQVRRFSTPIVAKGRIFVAGDGKLYAFRP